MGQRHSKSQKVHAEGSLTKYQKLKGRRTRVTSNSTQELDTTEEDLDPAEPEAHLTLITAAAACDNHTASSLTDLSVPILTRILHFLDPKSQECLRQTCHILYHLPEPSVTDPFADPEEDNPFADDAEMDTKSYTRHRIGSSESRTTRSQDHSHTHSHSHMMMSPLERDSLCHTCITTRTNSPAACEDRLAKATRHIHCARCKADHPRCLFSRLQRDATKIPQSIRYCIGHEGVLRMCEHKAVSWLQIVNLSREILKKQKHKVHVGRRWKVISCQHEDHHPSHNLNASNSSDGNGNGDVSDSGQNKKGRRSLGRLIENMRGNGCPTLTVGFKDSSKDFCLVLKWKGHVTLDTRSFLETNGGGASEGGLEKALGDKLKEVRAAQGRYICPEPKPGLKVEEMVLAGLVANRCDGRGPDERRKNKGKVPRDTPHHPPRSLCKMGTTTEIESVGSSISSTPLTHIPPILEEDTDTDDADAEVSIEIPSRMKSLVIKHGKLSGSAKVTWGLGLDLSGAEELWVPVVTDPPTADDVHNRRREKKQDEKTIHAHHHHERAKSHRHAITDSFKMKPCRASKLKKRKIIRHICHENKDEVCLKVKYTRRVYIGDHVRGASVRDFVGFQNWISLLDPESYKLTEDDEGFGVYWCRGVLDRDRRPAGDGNEGSLDHHQQEENKNRRATASMNLDRGTDLDTHPTRKELDTDKVKCRNYYRYIKSRTEGLKLVAGDYTRSCKKGSGERHPVKG